MSIIYDSDERFEAREIRAEVRKARRHSRCRFHVQERFGGDWHTVGVHHSRIVAVIHAWLGRWQDQGLAVGWVPRRVVDTEAQS